MGEDGAWTGDSVGAWRDGGFGFHDYERMECRGRGETRPPAPIPARAETAPLTSCLTTLSPELAFKRAAFYNTVHVLHYSDRS